MVSADASSAGRHSVRILLPREHGAYGQILFQMATALLIGHRSSAALALSAACTAVFVGHEAVVMLAGQRGARLARHRRNAARLSVACCTAIAASTGAWAIWHMSPASRASTLVPTALGLALAPLTRNGREHTAAGELLAAVALSSCSVPIARAGGVSSARAFTCWLVFALSFVVATVAVRSMIARVKRAHASTPLPSAAPGASTSLRAGSTGRRIGVPFWLAAGTVALSLLSATRGWIPFAAPLALLPVCGLALGVSLFPPHPRHLRTVGWSLVTATCATAIVLAVAV